MESYLDLEYRGEGNRAIVFANPKTKQVYRLVKYNATLKMRKALQNTCNEPHEDLKTIKTATLTELENVINYMKNVIRPLLSKRYVMSPKLTVLPKGFGEEAIELAGQARPAHRKNSQRDVVDPDVQCALVLPDCCFVCSPGAECTETNGESEPVKGGDSFDIQNGSDIESCPTDTDDLKRSSSCCSADSLGSSPHTDQFNDSIDAHFSVVDDDGDEDLYLIPGTETVANYGSDDSRLPHICDSSDRRSSGIVTSESLYYHSNDDCLERVNCSRNMAEKLEDSGFTLSIEIKPKKAFLSRSADFSDGTQVCRFCMHQHLKRKSGQWPQTSSYCPLDLFSGNKLRMKHALRSLIKTPQNNLKICKNGKEVYGSDIRQDLSAILSNWFPVKPKSGKKPISVFLDLVIELLLSSPCPDACDDNTCKQGSRAQGQKCESSSFVHWDEGGSDGLPHGCVLERIYSIQCLDDLDIEQVYPLCNLLNARMAEEPYLIKRWCLNGPYHDVSWLLGREGEQLDDLDPDSLDYAVLKVKRFLVSKTLQDCSVIVAIKPVTKSIQNKQNLFRFDGELYDFSISVVDLDPKPFEKIKTYFRQASDIALTFAEKGNITISDSADSQ